MKKPFAVWESEYPDDGSILLFAETMRGARRKYRRLTKERASGIANLIVLCVARLTVSEALALARSAS